MNIDGEFSSFVSRGNPCRGIREFACEECGKVAPFFYVTGGVQQRPCPDHPIILPDGSPLRGPYLQRTDTRDEWLIWSRNADGKIEIASITLPIRCIPIEATLGENIEED